MNIGSFVKQSRHSIGISDENHYTSFAVETSLNGSAASEVASCFPLVFESKMPGLDMAQWISDHRETLKKKLQTHGAILFRGFEIGHEAQFENCAKALSPRLVDYTHKSTPRNNIAGKVYTSTVYPSDRDIVMHSECSWTTEWPLILWFYCPLPAQTGGETPIADTRVIYQRIDAEIRERFERKGLLYVRNYYEGIDLPWQDVFNTENPDEVENYCTRIGMEFEWTDNKRILTTKQICQAVAAHPVTGEKVWFNQAHLFHASSDSSRYEIMKEVFSEGKFPRNTYYGDGSPIDPADIAHINQVYDECSILFPWQKSDLLLIDNMLGAHGRKAFTGSRKVLVAMSDPYHAKKGYL